MKAIEILREHLERIGVDPPVHVRREIVRRIKAARRQGRNPHTAVGAQCAHFKKK